MKKILYVLPEIFFIGFSAYWIQENYSASNSINYFAIVVMAIMTFQLIFKNRVIGIAGGIILALFSIFMMLAVRSEYSEFPKGSNEGLKFFLIAEGVFLLSLLIAGAMLFKFAAQAPSGKPMRHSIS